MNRSLWLILMGLFIYVSVSGCRQPEGDSDLMAASAQRSKLWLGFDGRGETLRADGSVIGELKKAFKGPTFYFKGSNLLGTDAEKLVDSSVEKVCSKSDELGQLQLYITGYSRGGSMAVESAARLQKSRCSSKLKLHWMGLVDAVDINVWHFADAVPSGMATLHIIKKTQGIKPHTQRIQAEPLREMVFDLTHGAIGYDDEVLSALKNHGRGMGAPW